MSLGLRRHGRRCILKESGLFAPDYESEHQSCYKQSGRAKSKRSDVPEGLIVYKLGHRSFLYCDAEDQRYMVKNTVICEHMIKA